MPMGDDRGGKIVAVRENVRLDGDEVTRDTLRCETAVLNRRRNAFDYDTTASVEFPGGHEPASCELHALFPSDEERPASGKRIVQLE